MTSEKIDPAEALRRLGEAGDGPHDIARAALMLSALDHSGRSLEPYEKHLADIAEAAKRDLRSVMHAEDAGRALSALMVGRFGYDGDRLTYDDSRNADLMEVIDRRRGMPVALGILYMHAARAAGLEAVGLNTPGHFLLRIAMRGSGALLDPFNGGAAIDRERLGRPPALGTPPPGAWSHPAAGTPRGACAGPPGGAPIGAPPPPPPGGGRPPPAPPATPMK